MRTIQLNVTRKVIKACPGRGWDPLAHLREQSGHPFPPQDFCRSCEFVHRSHNTRTPWARVHISHCSHMYILVHSPWLPGYIDVTQTTLIILTMAALFPDRSCVAATSLPREAESLGSAQAGDCSDNENAALRRPRLGHKRPRSSCTAR